MLKILNLQIKQQSQVLKQSGVDYHIDFHKFENVILRFRNANNCIVWHTVPLSTHITCPPASPILPVNEAGPEVQLLEGSEVDKMQGQDSTAFIVDEVVPVNGDGAGSSSANQHLGYRERGDRALCGYVYLQRNAAFNCSRTERKSSER